MSDMTGKIGWIDMTVDDANGVRDFYKAIVVPVRGLAGGKFCVIRDPAGSMAALYQP